MHEINRHSSVVTPLHPHQWVNGNTPLRRGFRRRPGSLCANIGRVCRYGSNGTSVNSAQHDRRPGKDMVKLRVELIPARRERPETLAIARVRGDCLEACELSQFGQVCHRKRSAVGTAIVRDSNNSSPRGRCNIKRSVLSQSTRLCPSMVLREKRPKGSATRDRNASHRCDPGVSRRPTGAVN